VHGEIRDQLAAEQAAPALQKMHDQIDDLRAAGKSLQEVAAAAGVSYIEIAATDRSGKAPDGKPALEGADAQRILETAFQGQVGLENDIVELADGGYAWVDVLAVTEPKQRSFAEVSAEVEALWREQETRRAVSDLAARLVERANRGDNLEALAREAGGKPETAKAFKRIGGAPGLPDGAVQQAFALGKGEAASAETRDGKSRVVFRVTDIVPAPPPGESDRERLGAELRRQMQGDVLAEYVAALQDRYGVSVNESILRRATGADTQQ
jgi:peptidyl-prolyl cis-trans isomerase D